MSGEGSLLLGCVIHLDLPVPRSKIECAEVLIVGKKVKGVINSV